MKLLEYQAKKVLSQYSLPVPKGAVVFSESEVEATLKTLGLTQGVVKAQAYTGGRGKAGGIKLFKSVEEAKALTKSMIGMTLVTHQTGPEGVIVSSVLLETASQIDKEFYVAITLDRANSSNILMLSYEGGVDIEHVAANHPHRILKVHLEYNQPLANSIIQKSMEFLSLPPECKDQWVTILNNLYKAYHNSDASLLEINPLILTADKQLSLLDCKFTVDENALFRQKELGGDESAELTPAEIEAKKYNLNYIQLDGNIGCMVNGAGLAMATMDIVKYFGASPANFLDVGGSASEEAIIQAFGIITHDKNVKVILVNIFGGIMQCDKIARGIIAAVQKTGLAVPLVVRLSGTSALEGRKIINESGLNVLSAENLADAAKLAVQQLKEQA